MALRKRLKDKDAAFPDPIYGVNLHAAEQDLQPGEARKMGNCYYETGISMRPGSTRLTANSLGSYAIRGGHMYYYGTSSKKRLVAYNNRISHITDAGAENVLTSGMTANQDTHFTTWSITDKVYIANGADVLREYDGTTFQLVSALASPANVPTARMVKPILDRLMCVTAAGLIERTSPRVAHQWSSNSSWATFRPQLGGPFTAIHPHTLRSANGDLFPGLVATQANAMYMITGTDFGSDATAASASTGEDAKLSLLDSMIGSSSPYSLCTVPGIGTFGVSSDLNVWWLPYGQASPRIIGDKIRSTNTTPGLESCSPAQLGQVWMQYHDRKLFLGFPSGVSGVCNTYFWLDIRSLQDYPDRGFVWSGPHTGFSVNRVWLENQYGDNSLKGGEGDSANGARVYNLHVSGETTDAVGASDVDIQFDYQTFFNPLGGASLEKYLQAIQIDATCFSGNPTVAVHDLHGAVLSGLTLTQI